MTKKTETETDASSPDQPAADGPTGKQRAGKQSAGLNDRKHDKAQQSAQEAEFLREGIFPALMASALKLEKFVDTPAFRVFLERLIDDAGRPTNPIARMMLEQLALTHFRIAQLQVQAAHSTGLEAAKIYNSMASRLLGEFRRSALALDIVSSRSSEPTPKARLRVFKLAQ